MPRLLDLLKKKRAPHPYENLKMGLIKQYSLIIPKSSLQIWLDKGWIENPDFRDFHYAPKPTETVVLGKPSTLSEIDTSRLVGRTIVNYSWYGTCGMGGPGFLGFTLDNQLDTEEEIVDENVLVYAVWGAAEYTLIDNRVVECSPQFYRDFHPWVSRFADEDIPNWDDLGPVLPGSRVDFIGLSGSNCIITVSKGDQNHIIEFFKNDASLPPFGNGNPRRDAFSLGVIGDSIVFQHEKAALHV